MAKICVLDKHTAELIAAGEVVERPASVVKELTENAIDAGAKNVTVSIEHGGVSMIQIADNGSGIEAESIPTAFLRHATSKIQSEEDLENIHTLGFRGEALASIASVARVELLTKTEQDEYAYCYRISGGQEEGIEPGARPQGTTITVRDLFYNTPARMKFLKKDTSEGNYVSDVVCQLALSHPEISFKFVREGKVQFQTPGDGKLLSAAYAVLSRDFAKDLVPVDQTQGNYVVRGLVTPPKSGRASRSMQHFFVNGRFVKNRTMMAALEAAYKGLLMQGRFPGCVLTLTMPAQLVDVNVHPAKTEVRFAREKEIFDVVYAAVKSVLITPESSSKTLTFEQKKTQTTLPISPDRYAAKKTEEDFRPPVQQIQAYGNMVSRLANASKVPYKAAYPEQEKSPIVDIPPRPAAFDVHREIKSPSQLNPPKTIIPEPPVVKEKPIEEPPVMQPKEPVAVQQMELPGAQTEEESLRFVGEVFDTYIIAQRNREICFIDKHAAHERILYEELIKHYGKVSSQMLLIPVSVRLSGEEKNALMQHQKILTDSGLEVEDFGGSSVVVRAVPADVPPDDVENLVVELASHLRENPRYTTSEKTEWVLHSIACRAAMKAGDKTHTAQLIRLAQDVMDGKIPPFCPHGRPVILRLTLKELEKQFGRQG